ncbi:MAG: hypothetical protein JOZ75_07875 [Candidatus Dormibacteraeota bacterium]|nr:hypothetical protein [Candidatus Dormibacteraeota bacterium]
MDALKWLAFAAGVLLFFATFVSVFDALVLPRGTKAFVGTHVASALRVGFRVIADRMPTYERRDTVLSYCGPGWLLAMLIVWLLMVWLSFALLMWVFLAPASTFFDALRLSGSSMFTLGFENPVGAAPLFLTLGAAAAGLGVVSLMIAFLPVVYNIYTRRETLVTLLDALGGSPAWGPEILARQELIDNTAALETLYQRWAEWAAEVSESHTTYRVLVYIRSPSPLRSWVIGLLAMLDAAALHLSLSPLTAPPTARWLMRTGIVSLRTVAASLEIPFNPDPKPDAPVSLTRAEFDEGVEWLTESGWKPERDLDDAWVNFRGWRVNYEAAAYGLARLIDAPQAAWSGPRSGARRVIPPERPPHRQPGPEFDGLRETTLRRRAARDGQHHVHPSHEGAVPATDKD